MNITNFVTGVTANITNQITPKSIPASVVGNALVDLANITKTNVDAISATTVSNTSAITTISASTVNNGTALTTISASTVSNTALVNSLSATTASNSTAIVSISASTVSNTALIAGKLSATDVFEAGLNKFNPADTGVELSKILNNGASGTSTNALYNTSGYIPITINPYTFSTVGRIHYFDTSKIFISSENPLSAIPYTSNPPTGATFMRASFLATNYATAQIQVGTVNRTYEAYNSTTVKATTLPVSVKDVISTQADLYPLLNFGNKIVNGDFSNSVNGHRFITTSTFVAPYAVTTDNTPMGSGTTVLQFSNSKRSSDGKLSVSRDLARVTIPSENIGKVVSFSFYYKGDSTYLTPSANIEFYGVSGFISSATFTLVADAITGVGSDYVKYNALNVAIPALATYIDFSVRVTTQAAAVADTIYPSYHTGLAAEFRPDRAVFERSVIDRLSANNALNIQNFVYGDLYGKKWTSYGDSITQYGYWQAIVVAKFGLIHTNRGIGGTTATENGSIAYLNPDNTYADRPPNAQPAGTTAILSSMCNQQRIDTIPLDTQIITVLAGTNDNILGLPIGTISDTGNTTFYGAYQIILTKLYARIPAARVLLMIFNHIKSEDTNPHGGFYAEDYRNAIRAIARKWKYRVIEMGSECGINDINNADFSSDGVHPIPPPALGYQLMANVAIRGFQQIFASV